MSEYLIRVKGYLNMRYARRPELLRVRARRDFAFAILDTCYGPHGSELSAREGLVLRMALDQLRIDNAWNALRARLRHA